MRLEELRRKLNKGELGSAEEEIETVVSCASGATITLTSSTGKAFSTSTEDPSSVIDLSVDNSPYCLASRIVGVSNCSGFDAVKVWFESLADWAGKDLTDLNIFAEREIVYYIKLLDKKIFKHILKVNYETSGICVSELFEVHTNLSGELEVYSVYKDVEERVCKKYEEIRKSITAARGGDYVFMREQGWD